MIHRHIPLIFKAVRIILAINGSALVRLARFGWRDFRKSLRDLATAADPFQSRTDISRMVDTYCRGQGVEIGPGNHPYCDQRNTVFADKFPHPQSGGILKIENAWVLPFKTNQFDFLLSSHCLEHCPDTLGTLMEWRRVVRPGGHLILILPHGLRTFDLGRHLTPLAHHIKDHEAGVGIRDPSHWEEFLRISVPAQHHFWLDNPEAYDAQGKLRRDWVHDMGFIHYHVWTPTEMVDLLRHVACRVLECRDRLGQRPDSFGIVAEVDK